MDRPPIAPATSWTMRLINVSHMSASTIVQARSVTHARCKGTCWRLQRRCPQYRLDRGPMPSRRFSRCVARKKSARRGWGEGGSAPRATDSRADVRECGTPASVRTLRHRVPSIDWTLVQYRASDDDVNDLDLPRRRTRSTIRPRTRVVGSRITNPLLQCCVKGAVNEVITAGTLTSAVKQIV